MPDADLIPRAMIDLELVLPCFNEEAILPTTISRLVELRSGLVAEGLIQPGSRITFVDDGSTDRTWEVIEDAARQHPFVHGIRLARNRGHQNALIAGLLESSADAVISADADLQDDPSAIREMILHFSRGAQIVYGIRDSRDIDTFFKRFTAEAYYRLMRRLGVDLKFNHADYRLMSRAALDALAQYSEVNLFLRGILPQLGFSTADVLYARKARVAGESKYPVRKMLSFAWDGLTSFSSLPLRWITMAGVVVSFLSFSMGLWVLLRSVFTDTTVPGWASIVIPVYFLGGIQLLGIGVIGEYIAKVYLETKRRPRYIVEKRI